MRRAAQPVTLTGLCIDPAQQLEQVTLEWRLDECLPKAVRERGLRVRKHDRLLHISALPPVRGAQNAMSPRCLLCSVVSTKELIVTRRENRCSRTEPNR